MMGVPAFKRTERQATFSGDSSCPFPVLGISHFLYMFTEHIYTFAYIITHTRT